MPQKESLYPSDWLRLAEKDLQRVTRQLDGHDFELAGFCLQQAVEKFLKAYLLSKGWKLRKIHNLDALLDDSLAYDDSLENYRLRCQRITAYYSLERYPYLTEPTITAEDVQDSLRGVMGLIETVRQSIVKGRR